ncbi:hypothetical protein C0991_008543 [Blastosporella zonata]|nr:hypothetical protein C0991_008543 [Blastosporella zonata]
MGQKKDVEKEVSVTSRNFCASPRRALYATAWILAFCIAASALGIVSQQLQRGGNSYANYGNMMYKHVLGVVLFSCLLVFLMCIGHFFTTIGSAFIPSGISNIVFIDYL